MAGKLDVVDPPASRLNRDGPRLFLGLVLLFLGGVGFGRLSDFDGWWHLRTGRLILDRGGIPRRDPFTWSALGDRWHPNSWASDVAYELARRAAGLPGVAMLRGALFVAVLLLIGTLARRAGSRPWPAVTAILVVGMALVPFVTERPQMFSYVLLPLAVLLATSALGGSNLALLGLAGVGCAWANLHGVVVLGVAVVGAIAAGHVVSRRRLLRPALVAVIPAVAALANPYGLQIYREAGAIRSLGRTLGIVEYRHPDLTQSPDLVVAVVAALAVVGLVRSGRWRRPEVVLPLGLLALATLDAIRSAPMLVILAAPEVALAFGTFGSPTRRAWLRERHAGPLALGGFLLMAFAAGFGVVNMAQVGQVDASQFPVGPVAAIPRGCRVLNEYEHGGYLIDRRWPQVAASQDSRADIFGQALLERQQAVLEDRDRADAWLDTNGVDCVLARPDRRLVRRLRTSPGWAMVAADDVGVLLVRRSR